MRPADQGLGADDTAAAQAHLGLIMQLQFAVGQRMPQFTLDTQHLMGALVHFRAIKQKIVFAGQLHARHRDIGITRQNRHIQTVFRIHRDADGGTDMQYMRFDHERRLHGVQQLLRNQACVFALLDAEQRHQKLVVFDLGEHIFIAQVLAELTRRSCTTDRCRLPVRKYR